MLGTGQQVIGQPDTKGGFDAVEQLGEAEAVDGEVAVERALEREPQASAAMRVEFEDELFDDL